MSPPPCKKKRTTSKTSSDSKTDLMDIEKLYLKKTLSEHVLLRPDTYIGSIDYTEEMIWVYNAEKERMIQRELRYVPGLYKIFDEILVNAADNKQRDPEMSKIKIEINKETNVISIWNDGEGIPATKHKQFGIYIPTMIFGQLLTSSNYDDEKKRIVSGRNGFGAKLCNIFSKEFVVETATKKYQCSFKQVWKDNMTNTEEPIINDFDGNDYTKITFSPDLSKFNMEQLDDDIVTLMSRRAMDVAATTRGVYVYLNGKKLAIKSFKDYIDLYVKKMIATVEQPFKIAYEVCGKNWEIACCASNHGFQQMSFVNTIATTKGGRHVEYVVQLIANHVLELVKRKNKEGVAVRAAHVRNQMWLFINCYIENPTFDSQTKQYLTMTPKHFSADCQLGDSFLNKVSKCGIVENVLKWARAKAETEMNKAVGKRHCGNIKGIAKLEDANEAGTKNSMECVLILTEGDSAKSLAVSGLSVVGRDCYGVFPLRGKLLNVRDAHYSQIANNVEINNLCKIIGLQYKKKYETLEDLQTLRYGKVMIMTDQDQDGSHIKGLLINFIHHHWPELLRLPFLEEFITPLVKAFKQQHVHEFYSLPEFEEWKAKTPDHHTYQIKYYKGLGTSTSKEAKDYFKEMDKHCIEFVHNGELDDESFVMAFSKKHVKERKRWLSDYMNEMKRLKTLGLPEPYLYTKGTTAISYADFVNRELILYSNADNVRSIPSLVDGLKPGQRKVMYTCFKRNDKREVKVAQLAGSVAEMSAYHHGEASLQATIVNLAQNFVGSNNINLLEPRGQFGTRLVSGKDAASARYIFTMMSPITRLIYHPADDPLLTYQDDDGQHIEPQFYVPIIPMVLVNGAEGIGTGWSTKIPNYNPRDIIDNLKRMLEGKAPVEMHPWYKNFQGKIVPLDQGRYVVAGNLSMLPSGKFEITELPVGVWSQTYKENVLEQLYFGTPAKPAVLTDFREYNTDLKVRYVLTMELQTFERYANNLEDLYGLLKLQKIIHTNQMHCFDHIGCLRHFPSALDILKEFYSVRLAYYEKRKDFLLAKLIAQTDRLSDQARFIVEICEHKLNVENKPRKKIIELLVKRGYRADPVKEWQKRMESVAGDEEEEEEQMDYKEECALNFKHFEYLLGMPIWMLTIERKKDLIKQRDKKLHEIEVLQQKSIQDLWLQDLKELEKYLDDMETNETNSGMTTRRKRRNVETTRNEQDIGNPDPKGILVEFQVSPGMYKLPDVNNVEDAAESKIPAKGKECSRKRKQQIKDSPTESESSEDNKGSEENESNEDNKKNEDSYDNEENEDKKNKNKKIKNKKNKDSELNENTENSKNNQDNENTQANEEIQDNEDNGHSEESEKSAEND